MKRDDLIQALQELHEELDRSESLDPESRRLLVELKGDIEDLLGESDAPDPDAPESLDERLRNSIIHFEGTHPALTVAINRVVDALAAMGL